MHEHKWYRSDVLDDGHNGIVTEKGGIVIGAKSPLSEDQADKIVAVHNASLGLTPPEPSEHCWNCGNNFTNDPNVDCMDATCYLCHAPYDKKRCDEFKFKPSSQPSGGKVWCEHIWKYAPKQPKKGVHYGESWWEGLNMSGKDVELFKFCPICAAPRPKEKGLEEELASHMSMFEPFSAKHLKTCLPLAKEIIAFLKKRGWKEA